MSCRKRHAKRRVKLLVKFGPAKAGTIVEAELCPDCGVSVKARQPGCNCSGRTLLANLVTIPSPAPLSFEGGPAVRAPPRSGMLPGFPVVPEKCKIAAEGGAVEFWLSRDRLPNALVQQPPAPVTLFSDVQTLGPDVGDLGGGELHGSLPANGHSMP